MKNKKILFSLLALVIAGSVMIFTTSGISKQKKYIPRKEQNHKAAYGINGAVEYLKTIRNNQVTGEIDAKWVFTAREDVRALANNKSGKSLGLSWSELGPDNIGGRTRAILIDKNNPNIIYAGGVSGGLWKSTSGGSSWIQIPSVDVNIVVASIAQGADGTIYVGTGEGIPFVGYGTANGCTSFIGKGIYKSTDGVNFSLLPSTTPTIDNSTSVAWAFVNKLACDPVNPLRIYAATNKGMRSSDDGGSTWIVPIYLTATLENTGNSTDVDVASDGTVITSVGNKCYISPNGNDNTFVNQSTGSSGHLPNTGISRAEFAVAPSNPNYMYASIAKTDGALLNIYRSTDKGLTWSVIGPGGSTTFQPYGTQGWYDNTLVVHPTNPDKIFCGGLDMWGWVNGGTWTQKSLWYLESTSAYYIHADHHIYVFHPTNPNVMYIGSDGGVSRSSDGGQTFQTMNINYNTIQSYAVSCSPSGMIMTGTQDNGTLFLPRTGAFPKHGYSIMGGDGGWSAFSYVNPEAYFATIYNAGTGRSPDNGSTFYPGGDGSNPFFSARMLALGSPGSSSFPAAFVTPLLMWESFNDTYSSDSIKFTPTPVLNEKIGKGATGTTHFDTILARSGQIYASIIPGSLEIRAGSLYVTDDGSNHLTGSINPDSTNTIDYNTGEINITFSTAPAVGLNILASYGIKYNAGSTISMESGTRPGKFDYITPVTIDQGDTVMIQDIIQAKFYIGFTNAIWMTKEALDFSKQPEWFKVASFNAGSYQTTQCLALSQDGNYLYVGTTNGYLYRISNLRAAQDSISADAGTTALPNIYSVVETKQLTIPSSGRAITSIAVDPNNANNVVVTLGNYGNAIYVYYSTNALDNTPVFNAKQGAGSTALPKMPVYSSLIPLLHSGTVIIGSEYGVYSTDNISSPSPVWTDENTGLSNVPVYMLRQQTYNYPGVTNCGTIYIGTHGRGTFECTKYYIPGINDPDQPGSSSYTSPFNVSLYPNPVVDNATLSFTLPKTGNVKAKVYDMSGKIVKSIDMSQLSKGYHTYTVNFSDLKRGTYIIHLVSGELSAGTKFLIY
ncbi:MAG: T9SS type A sorting domain-containing protein [Bacteroidales bacterium]